MGGWVECGLGGRHKDWIHGFEYNSGFRGLGECTNDVVSNGKDIGLI